MANVKFQRAKLFIFTDTVDPKSQYCNGNLTISHPNNKTRVSISLVDPTNEENGWTRHVFLLTEPYISHRKFTEVP